MTTATSINTQTTPLANALAALYTAAHADQSSYGLMHPTRKTRLTAGMGAAMLVACGTAGAGGWTTEIDRVDGVVISADFDGSGDESIAFVVGTDYPNTGDPTAWSTVEIFPTLMIDYYDFQVNGNTTLGNASSDSTTINGSLSVSNGSTLNGTTNLTGNIQNNSGDLILNDNVNVTGVLYNSGGAFSISDDATVSGTFGVTGTTTLTGALTANGGVSTTTVSTTGNTSVGGTLGVTGTTTLSGATVVNNTFSIDSNGATAGGNTLVVNASGTSLAGNGATSTLNGSTATLLNSTSHGLTVGATSTTLSGGTTTTSMTLDDSGVSFTDDGNGEIFAVDNSGAASIGRTDLAGALGISDGAGSDGVSFNGATGEGYFAGNVEVGGDLDMTNGNITNVAGVYSINDMVIDAGNSVAGGDLYLNATGGSGANGNINLIADGANNGVVNISSGSHGVVVDAVNGIAAIGSTNTLTASTSNTISTTGGGSLSTTTSAATLAMSGGGSVTTTLAGTAISGTTNTITGTTNTITGTTNINTTGSAGTSIGNTTGNVGITGAAVTINTANSAGLSTSIGSTNAGAGNVLLQAGGLNAMTISTAAGTAVAGAFTVDSNGATANAAGTGTLSVANNASSMGVVQGGLITTSTGSASIQGYNAAGFASNGTAGNASHVGAGNLTVYNSVQTVASDSTINNLLEGRQYSNMINGNLFVDGNVYINGTLDYVSANSASTTVIGSSGSSKLDDASQGTTGGTNIVMKGVNGAEESSATLTLTNGYGNTHGVEVYEDRTVLSGGVTSTTLTLDDSGATFRNTHTGGGPARVTGVADGTQRYDAVNYGQLRKAYQGVASVAALASLPDPMPGKKHSMGMGYGNYESSDAVAFGYRGDLNNRIRVTAGVSLSAGQTTTGVGAGFSW